MTDIIRTARTTLKRLPERGKFDRAVLNAVLDEALICHVGFLYEGLPVVIPTSFGRSGEQIFIHGSAASRMLRTLSGGVQVSVAVTLLDGLVLARSAFHHSMNYRSAVVFGVAQPITSREEKIEALRVIVEHLVPGRWNDVRPPSELELKGTTVLALALDEASVKIRTGPPKDDEEDYDLPIWAGELSFSPTAGAPLSDPRLPSEIPVPDSIKNYRRPRQD